MAKKWRKSARRLSLETVNSQDEAQNHLRFRVEQEEISMLNES